MLPEVRWKSFAAPAAVMLTNLTSHWDSIREGSGKVDAKPEDLSCCFDPLFFGGKKTSISDAVAQSVYAVPFLDFHSVLPNERAGCLCGFSWNWMTEQKMIRSKKTVLFYMFVVMAVCTVHVAVFYAVARYAPAKISTVMTEKINTMELVRLSKDKALPVEKQKPQQTQSGIPNQPKKNEPRQKNIHQESLMVPKKAPEKQLAAKVHEEVKDHQQAKIAQNQPMQTAQTDKPVAQAFSAISLSGGDANRAVGQGKEITGMATESTARKVGKESGVSGGGAKDRSASTISINKYYPEGAKRQNVTGVVTVKVTVGSNGRVKDTSIISSTDARLTAAGKKAAALAKYRPAIKNGEPVEDTIAVRITYDLTS